LSSLSEIIETLSRVSVVERGGLLIAKYSDHGLLVICMEQPPELLVLIDICRLILLLGLSQVLQAVRTRRALATEIHSDCALEKILILCRLLI
jgi:hypothetical protein